MAEIPPPSYIRDRFPPGPFGFHIYGEAMEIMRQNVLPFAAFGLIGIIITMTAGQVGNVGQFVLMMNPSQELGPGMLSVLALGSLVGLLFQMVAAMCSILGVSKMVQTQMAGFIPDVAEGFQPYRFVFPIAVTVLPMVAAFLPGTLMSVSLYDQILQLDQSNMDIERFFAIWTGAMMLMLVSLVAMVIVGVLFSMAPFFVVHQGLSGGQALARSFHVCKKHFFGLFGMHFLNSIIYSIGFMCCCIGGAFTFPYVGVVMTLAFRDLANFPLVLVPQATGYSPYPRAEVGEMPPTPPNEPPR